jgi:hypothetical protein
LEKKFPSQPSATTKEGRKNDAKGWGVVEEIIYVNLIGECKNGRGERRMGACVLWLDAEERGVGRLEMGGGPGKREKNKIDISDVHV